MPELDDQASLQALKVLLALQEETFSRYLQQGAVEQAKALFRVMEENRSKLEKAEAKPGAPSDQP